MISPLSSRREVLLGLLALAASATGVRAAAGQAVALLELNGFRPEKLSTNMFRILRGSLADSTGRVLVTSQSDITVDLSKVGLNGRDSDFSLVAGTQLYLYILMQISSGTVGAVASRAISYRNLTLPPGWRTGDVAMRKLPFGVPYDPLWDGIPSYYCANWPMPLITFTDQETTPLWSPLINGKAKNWTMVECSKWIPDNARMGLFTFQVRDAGLGRAGSALVRSYGGQKTGILVGETSPSAPYTVNTRPLRVTSARTMEYVTSGGAMLDILCLGYYMGEQS